jgi:hypothetical protein
MENVFIRLVTLDGCLTSGAMGLSVELMQGVYQYSLFFCRVLWIIILGLRLYIKPAFGLPAVIFFITS